MLVAMCNCVGQGQAILSYLLVATLASAMAASKSKTIHILCLLPYPHPDPLSNPSWREGPPISVALDMARDEINNQTELLPDYRIELIHDDSGCEYTTRAYVGFMRNVYSANSRNKVVGIIGPGCSSASLALAPIVSNEEVAIVTVHGGGSPFLSNRTTYRYALSSLGVSESFALIGVELMSISGWSRVGVLFDESRLFFSSTFRAFKEIKNNFSIGFSSPVYETFIPLEVIVSERLRINFLFTPAGTTQRVLCLAMHRGMVYDAYQWVVLSNTFAEVARDVTFTYENNRYNCTKNEMKTIALNRAIFLNYRLSPLNETAPSTFSRHSFQEYKTLYQERIADYNSQSPQTNISYSVWSTYFYDSLWAWSVVLDSIIGRNSTIDFTEPNYVNTALADMILEEFYSLDFDGVSGRIKFNNESGFVTRATSVIQVINSAPEVYSEERFKQLSYIPDNFGARQSMSGPVLIAVSLTIATVQLVILVILHILTIKWREHHTVKASSVKLNQLTFFGCYLFSFTLLLYSISNLELEEFDTFTIEILCNLTWAWLLPISFTLTFGTVAGRTWRLYQIFTHYLNPGRFIGDFYLMGFVFILLLVDVIVGTIWMATDPQRVQALNYTVHEGVAVFQVTFYMCAPRNYFGSLVPVFSLRVILMAVVLVLAFLTRNIGNQSFTTKTLRVLVYLFSAVMVLGFLCYYITLFTSPLSSLRFVSLAITFNLMLFLFLTLVFLPPLVPILRGKFYNRFPNLKKEMSSASSTESIPMVGSSRFYI